MQLVGTALVFLSSTISLLITAEILWIALLNSGKILSDMDISVDPCDNFYRFSCGGFLKKTTIPDDVLEVNAAFTVVNGHAQQVRSAVEEPSPTNEPQYIKAVKNFYKSCMNEAITNRGPEFLKQKMKELGGWPVLEGPDWNESNFDWIESIRKFRKVGWPINNFWEWGIARKSNSNKTILELGQPSMTRIRESLISGMNSTSVDKYFKHMVDIAVLLGAPRDIAIIELTESVKFEIALAKIKLTNEDYNNRTELTITELSEKYPSIPWKDLINYVIAPHITADNNVIVAVAEPEFMSKLIKLMNTTSRKVQATFVLWRAAEFAFPYFNKNMSGTNPSPRWERCISEIREFVPTDILYVRKYFNPSAKNNASEIVANIRNQLKRIIQNVDWMDDETRNNALKKIVAMASHVGFPDEFSNNSLLEKTFKELDFNDDNYAENIFIHKRYTLNKFFSKLGESAFQHDWIHRPSIISTTAQYYSPTRSVDAPAGFLQGIFFNENRPKYMNYGAFGSVIGHEMTHAFGDVARMYDELFNREKWWTPATDEKLGEKKTCFVNQYNRYTIEEIGQKMNGFNTQEENIADNAGFKIAYLAYEDWLKKHDKEKTLPGLNYSSQQMFWISGANIYCSKVRIQILANRNMVSDHSPSEFRILGSFRNLPEFATDFNCPVGSKMNPKDKCTYW